MNAAARMREIPGEQRSDRPAGYELVAVGGVWRAEIDYRLNAVRVICPSSFAATRGELDDVRHFLDRVDALLGPPREKMRVQEAKA